MARRILCGVLTAAAASVAAAGIYPDGHWDRSTKLTTSNADDFIKKHVDDGKTVMAPSWNKVTEDFAENEDVVFADVSLSSDQVRTINGVEQSPGAGGWPTVRHFNKQTGYGGEGYKKKTGGAMCDELGPKEDYMKQYVEEAAGTSLCSVLKADKGCSAKEQDFIKKWSEKSKDDLQKQLDRLTTMIDKDGESMKAEALGWAKKRLGIFKQLTKTAAAAKSEL